MRRAASGADSRALDVVRDQLRNAAAAKKCHPCGCLHQTLDALADTGPGKEHIADAIAGARAVLRPKQYDCLGCTVCYPAIAVNAFAEAYPAIGEGLNLCPTETPAERTGWPPLPGDYRVLEYQAPVAVCTLNSSDLSERLAGLNPRGLGIVGTLHTENLGIERLIQNTIANPNLRVLVVCGDDTQQAIGHLPGRSLEHLFRDGVDERGRIIGAPGKRPILKNVTSEEINTFLKQVTFVPLIGETNPARIAETVEGEASRDNSGLVPTLASTRSTPVIDATEPHRLVQDPAGYLVIYPDRQRRRLLVEHYTTDGSLDRIVQGQTATALYATIIDERLISRLDHAAYLGRELARAEHSLQTGEPYTQDRAPGEGPAETGPNACGCATARATEKKE